MSNLNAYCNHSAGSISDEALDQVSGGWEFTQTGENGGTFHYFSKNDGGIGMVYHNKFNAGPPVHFVNGLLVKR